MPGYESLTSPAESVHVAYLHTQTHLPDYASFVTATPEVLESMLERKVGQEVVDRMKAELGSALVGFYRTQAYVVSDARSSLVAVEGVCRAVCRRSGGSELRGERENIRNRGSDACGSGYGACGGDGG